MKFSIFAAISVLAAVAHAKVRIISPDADTVWNAGESATIKWKSDSKDSKLKCDIQLLNGDPADADIIGSLTKDSPPKCSKNSFTIESLDDYPAGTVFLRIGQESKHKWSYSEDFKFQGDGSSGNNSSSGSNNDSASGSASGSGSGSDAASSSDASSATTDPTEAAPTEATPTEASPAEATPTDSWLNTSPAASPTTAPETGSGSGSDDPSSILAHFSSLSVSVAAAKASNQ
ncbi:hypothetical protein CLU79DRAFT_844256 [Phycomyces nitens]|nr:hypothetical protein CLU79DRAFT_844256 [Phycomyces nitens]